MWAWWWWLIFESHHWKIRIQVRKSGFERSRWCSVISLLSFFPCRVSLSESRHIPSVYLNPSLPHSLPIDLISLQKKRSILLNVFLLSIKLLHFRFKKSLNPTYLNRQFSQPCPSISPPLEPVSAIKPPPLTQELLPLSVQVPPPSPPATSRVETFALMSRSPTSHSPGQG